MPYHRIKNRNLSKLVFIWLPMKNILNVDPDYFQCTYVHKPTSTSNNNITCRFCSVIVWIIICTCAKINHSVVNQMHHNIRCVVDALDVRYLIVKYQFNLVYMVIFVFRLKPNCNLIYNSNIINLTNITQHI